MGGDGQWVTEVNAEEGRVGVKGGGDDKCHLIPLA